MSESIFPKIDRLAVKLRPVAERSVKKGHPWVYSDSVVKLNKEGKAGDLAILFSQDKNEVYGIGLYDPDSPIRIKIIHSGSGKKIDRSFFQEKLRKAYLLRKPLHESDTNGYRLISGENDGFPGLVVDVYHTTAVLKIYSEIWLNYLPLLRELIKQQIEIDSLVLRLSRLLQKKKLPYTEGEVLYGDLNDPELLFKEYGVHFYAHVLQGHKTGFFLDHRENRRRIGELSKGKKVLDVFSYAGGFSVHALVGGAQEVHSVDISEQALALAKRNAQLNSHVGKHYTWAGDAFHILKQFIQQKKTFDVVIIDPPSFAKSEKENEVALLKYEQLAAWGARLTNNGGVLLLASCSSRVIKEEFLKIHKNVFQKMGVAYRIIAITDHDVDHPVTFPEGAYLKSAYYQIEKP